jgi:hypothetical protein
MLKKIHYWKGADGGFVLLFVGVLCGKISLRLAVAYGLNRMTLAKPPYLGSSPDAVAIRALTLSMTLKHGAT